MILKRDRIMNNDEFLNLFDKKIIIIRSYNIIYSLINDKFYHVLRFFVLVNRSFGHAKVIDYLIVNISFCIPNTDMTVEKF